MLTLDVCFYLVLYVHFQVASELNAALLRADHAECIQPHLSSLLKLLLWSQSELAKKGIRFSRPIDLAKDSKKVSFRDPSQ